MKHPYNREQDNTGLPGPFVQSCFWEKLCFLSLSSQEKMIYLFTTDNTTVMKKLAWFVSYRACFTGTRHLFCSFKCMSFSSLYCVVLTIVPPWVNKIHSFIHYNIIACANNLWSSIGGINVSVIWQIHICNRSTLLDWEHCRAHTNWVFLDIGAQAFLCNCCFHPVHVVTIQVTLYDCIGCHIPMLE